MVRLKLLVRFKEIETELNKVYESLVVTNQEPLCTNLTGFKSSTDQRLKKRDLDYILNGKKCNHESQSIQLYTY